MRSGEPPRGAPGSSAATRRRARGRREATPPMKPPAARPRGYEPLPSPVDALPRHIAFIMDGNGRWARRQGLLRLCGHEQGAESLRRITRYCAQIGIAEITFYALSTENYLRRPKTEVAFLMKLLKR